MKLACLAFKEEGGGGRDSFGASRGLLASHRGHITHVGSTGEWTVLPTEDGKRELIEKGCWAPERFSVFSLRSCSTFLVLAGSDVQPANVC